jgi:hypothetical protein
MLCAAGRLSAGWEDVMIYRTINIGGVACTYPDDTIKPITAEGAARLRAVIDDPATPMQSKRKLLRILHEREAAR